MKISFIDALEAFNEASDQFIKMMYPQHADEVPTKLDPFDLECAQDLLNEARSLILNVLEKEGIPLEGLPEEDLTALVEKWNDELAE